MIEVQGLTKYYGALAALRGIDFEVGKGEVIGFLGPNGAGKSTTMRILTGFTPATGGVARVAGFDVHAQPMEVKRRVGYLPERVPLYEEMVVGAFLGYVAEIKGVARRERKVEVGRVMERCGLEGKEKRLIRNLSKGFRQRVGLAQALVGSPPVLILDEPTVGLDPRQIVGIRKMIAELGEEHTVLLSTHILPEVAMVCQRVVIINEGRLVEGDPLEGLSGEAPEARSRRLETAFMAAVASDKAGHEEEAMQ
jgi:ABC-2 type transport system ATP-binding protein